MKRHDKLAETIPVGTLGILALESSKSMGQKVNDYKLTGVPSVLHSTLLLLLSQDTTEIPILLILHAHDSVLEKQKVSSVNQ